MNPTPPPTPGSTIEEQGFDYLCKYDEGLAQLESDDIGGKRAKALIQRYVRKDWKWPNTSPEDCQRATVTRWRVALELGQLELRRRVDDSDFFDDTVHILEKGHMSDEDVQSGQPLVAHHPHSDQCSVGRDTTLAPDGQSSSPEESTGIQHFEARRNAWTGAIHSSSLPINYPIQPSLASDSHGARQHISIRAQVKHRQDISPLLPVPSRWLPSHPARFASCQEKNYGEIYTRFVVTGTTPNLPINLRDVVRCCVVGWKRDGHWDEAAKQGAQQNLDGVNRSGTGARRSITQRPKDAVKRGVVGVRNGLVNTVKGRRGGGDAVDDSREE